jgi:hypothetical protein
MSSPRTAGRTSSIVNTRDTSPNQPSFVETLRTSSRLAAKRAQTAIKRTVENLEGVADEPTKRARLSVPADDGESSFTDESDNSQTTPDNGSAANTSEHPMQTILGSMAGVAKEESGSTSQSKVITAVSDKPPAGKLLVWASARGSLCEALPYFRAFKGSLHSANLVAQGFLIDHEVDQHDVFGAQVIISSV